MGGNVMALKYLDKHHFTQLAITFRDVIAAMERGHSKVVSYIYKLSHTDPSGCLWVDFPRSKWVYDKLVSCLDLESFRHCQQVGNLLDEWTLVRHVALRYANELDARDPCDLAVIAYVFSLGIVELDIFPTTGHNVVMTLIELINVHKSPQRVAELGPLYQELVTSYPLDLELIDYLVSRSPLAQLSSIIQAVLGFGSMAQVLRIGDHPSFQTTVESGVTLWLPHTNTLEIITYIDKTYGHKVVWNLLNQCSNVKHHDPEALEYLLTIRPETASQSRYDRLLECAIDDLDLTLAKVLFKLAPSICTSFFNRLINVNHSSMRQYVRFFSTYFQELNTILESLTNDLDLHTRAVSKRAIVAMLELACHQARYEQVGVMLTLVKSRLSPSDCKSITTAAMCSGDIPTIQLVMSTLLYVPGQTELVQLFFTNTIHLYYKIHHLFQSPGTPKTRHRYGTLLDALDRFDCIKKKMETPTMLHMPIPNIRDLSVSNTIDIVDLLVQHSVPLTRLLQSQTLTSLPMIKRFLHYQCIDFDLAIRMAERLELNKHYHITSQQIQELLKLIQPELIDIIDNLQQQIEAQRNIRDRASEEKIVRLDKEELSIKDLQFDLADGIMLANLLEILSGKNVILSKCTTKHKSRLHLITNLNYSLDFMKNEGLNISTSAPEINDGVQKMILGMIWTLILRYQIQTLTLNKQLLNSSGSSTNLRQSPREMLLSWVQNQLKDYDGLLIKDLTSSFRDGIAFCAIIHKLIPTAIPDIASLQTTDPLQNLTLAFETAKRELNIPAILDPQDVLDSPNEQCILTYLSFFPKVYQKFQDPTVATPNKRFSVSIPLSSSSSPAPVSISLSSIAQEPQEDEPQPQTPKEVIVKEVIVKEVVKEVIVEQPRSLEKELRIEELEQKIRVMEADLEEKIECNRTMGLSQEAMAKQLELVNNRVLDFTKMIDESAARETANEEDLRKLSEENAGLKLADEAARDKIDEQERELARMSQDLHNLQEYKASCTCTTTVVVLQTRITEFELLIVEKENEIARIKQDMTLEVDRVRVEHEQLVESIREEQVKEKDVLQRAESLRKEVEEQAERDREAKDREIKELLAKIDEVREELARVKKDGEDAVEEHKRVKDEMTKVIDAGVLERDALKRADEGEEQLGARIREMGEEAAKYIQVIEARDNKLREDGEAIEKLRNEIRAMTERIEQDAASHLAMMDEASKERDEMSRLVKERELALDEAAKERSDLERVAKEREIALGEAAKEREEMEHVAKERELAMEEAAKLRDASIEAVQAQLDAATKDREEMERVAKERELAMEEAAKLRDASIEAVQAQLDAATKDRDTSIVAVQAQLDAATKDREDYERVAKERELALEDAAKLRDASINAVQIQLDAALERCNQLTGECDSLRRSADDQRALLSQSSLGMVATNEALENKVRDAEEALLAARTEIDRLTKLHESSIAQGAIIKSGYESGLTELRADLESKMTSAKEEYERILLSVKEECKETLDANAKEFELLLEAKVREHTEIISNMDRSKGDYESELAAARVTMEQELAALKDSLDRSVKDHQVELENKDKEHVEASEKIKQELAATKDSLVRSVKDHQVELENKDREHVEAGEKIKEEYENRVNQTKEDYERLLVATRAECQETLDRIAKENSAQIETELAKAVTMVDVEQLKQTYELAIASLKQTNENIRVECATSTRESLDQAAREFERKEQEHIDREKSSVDKLQKTMEQMKKSFEAEKQDILNEAAESEKIMAGLLKDTIAKLRERITELEDSASQRQDTGTASPKFVKRQEDANDRLEQRIIAWMETQQNNHPQSIHRLQSQRYIVNSKIVDIHFDQNNNPLAVSEEFPVAIPLEKLFVKDDKGYNWKIILGGIILLLALNYRAEPVPFRYTS
eukprot:gene14763-17443_t